MPYVETPLGRLFVQTQGAGPAISFWHCLLGDGGIWHAHVHALASRARAIVVDGPGHGRSSPPPGPFTLEQCADAWVDVLDACGVREPATLVGLSWGALVALRVALRHPQRVRALGVVSAIATAPRRAARAKFAAFAALLRAAGVAAPLVPRLADMMTSRSCDQRARDEVHRMLSRCATLNRRGLYRGARAVLVDPTPIVRDLPRIAVPTLVCVGAEDRVTPVSCARCIAGAVPGAELRVVPGAGHLVPIEKTETVRALLKSLV